ncbi:hypothetical protein DMC30DRAFT_415887 [Rhodotorula diobovata]|uniref:F-box domain-containing protein n=1 Tax=Rhodotorula diobovata TaxID=5288 RepID=A0A5C5FZK0_9BASI|nr:hypothetical protein DMC30DRAFT_415887 [Rhodotorula diobovata]
MSAAHARGLTSLPEELVDLVCAFVVDFDVEDVITTLCSLALTSRRLFEPARRALWHDPSRILATRDAHSAHIFLGRVIKNPALGAHVKRLEGVVDMFTCVPALSLDHDHPVAFTNWAFTLLQHCPHVIGLSVWPDPEAGWLGQLEHLPRLRHLTVQARDLAVYFDVDIYSCFDFLAGVSAVRLDSLTLRDYYGPRGDTRWAVHLPVTRLELDRYGPHLWANLGIFLGDVRNMTLRPHSYVWDPETLLPPALEAFALLPPTRTDSNEYLIWGPEEWGELFAEPRRFTDLRVVVLANVEIDFPAFEQLCAAAPTLERVDLRHGLWQEYTCPEGTCPDASCPGASCPDAFMDVRLVEALSTLPELRFLHLGKFLRGGDAILDTRVYCHLFGVELEWRERFLPRLLSSGRNVVEADAFWQEDDEDAMSVTRDGRVSSSGDGDDDDDDSLGRPHGQHWQVHRLRINNNGSSITSSSSTSSPYSSSVPAVPSAAPSSPGTFPFAPDLPSYPPISRSPSPPVTPDDDERLAALSSIVVARPAAADQRYVDAPASPSHLEPGYEARDDSDDEALEADGGYGSDCDVDEADRQWKEYDDEGLWECARERFED